MKNQTRRIVSSVVSLVLIVTPLVAWNKRQDIFDWWRLNQYQPSSQIEALSSNTTMTDYGQKLFYVYHAELNDKEAFNRNCSDTEQTIILGCYVTHDGIYIFNVTDERLQGIKEVTAAHEVLHAGYDRLSDTERNRIDNLVLKVYGELDNPRIRKTVASYEKKDPNIVPNELHSIVGTEVRDVGPELEEYYARYFSNRTKIVEYSEQYEKAFTERENQIEAYDAQLERLQRQIDSNNTAIDNAGAQLNQEKARLQSLLDQKRYQEYNAAVPGFNAQVRSYNALVVETRNLIDQFNDIVAKRNALALEENELIKAIDSRPNTIESQ